MIIFPLGKCYKSRLYINVFYVIFETTGFDGTGHAIETTDVATKALALLSEDIP